MADYEDEEYGGGGGGFAPCPHCGRTFNPDTLARHAKICQKTQSKKRKVFDSGKQRAMGSDIPTKATIRPGQQPKANAGSGTKASPPSKNNWRQKHQEFIAAIRNARGVSQALKTGAPLPPPPAPSINPDYIQCQYCGRRFNEKAHGRHEPFCKEKHDRISSKPVISDQAKQRAAARTQYRAPRLKQKTEMNMTSTQQNGGYGTRPSAGGTRTGGMRRDSTDSLSGAYGNMTKSRSTGQVSDPGMGRPMRTGRDPQSYEDAKKSVRGTNMARGNMSRGTPPSSGRTMANSDSSMPAGRQGSAGGKFCHECGTKYPVATAKFCVNCGVRRLAVGGF